MKRSVRVEPVKPMADWKGWFLAGALVLSHPGTAYGQQTDLNSGTGQGSTDIA